MWSITHAECGYEYFTTLFRAITYIRGESIRKGGQLRWARGKLRRGSTVFLPHVIAIFRVSTLTLISDDNWSRNLIWSMSRARCGYEYMTILFRAGTCMGQYGKSDRVGGKRGFIPSFPMSSLFVKYVLYFSHTSSLFLEYVHLL